MHDSARETKVAIKLIRKKTSIQSSSPQTGSIAAIVCFVVFLLACFALMVYCIKRGQKRTPKEHGQGESVTPTLNAPPAEETSATSPGKHKISNFGASSPGKNKSSGFLSLTPRGEHWKDGQPVTRKDDGTPISGQKTDSV